MQVYVIKYKWKTCNIIITLLTFWICDTLGNNFTSKTFTKNSIVSKEVEGSASGSGLISDKSTVTKLECGIQCGAADTCKGFIVNQNVSAYRCQLFDRILRRLHTPVSITTAAYYRLDIVECPSDFYWYNGMCFKEYTTPMTWTDAMTSCQQEGGFLFHVSTAERQTFVQGAFDTNHDYHLGGFKEDGIWKWPDGTLLTSGYTNWGTSPSTGNCLKVETEGSFLWADIDCDVDLLHALCEIPIPNY